MPDVLTFIRRHYEQFWNRAATVLRLTEGPFLDLPLGFSVLRFEPENPKSLWIYATCGMSEQLGRGRVELYMYSPIASDWIVELLTIVAHYHCTGSNLDLHHTVNFGRPWLPGATCSHGLVSLPYVDGPLLEHPTPQAGQTPFRVLWLLPITPEELAFKKRDGVEALEKRFDNIKLKYWDVGRKSAV